MVSALLLKVSHLLCFKSVLVLIAWRWSLTVTLGPTGAARSFPLMHFYEERLY